MKSPHQVLGIPPTATQDEAKQAYRRLAKRYHPDVSTEPDAEARFKEISAAYEAIKNPQPQAEVHRPTPGSFEDFLRGFAGAGTVMHNATVHLSLNEAYTGTVRTVSWPNHPGTEIHIPPGVRSGTQFAVDRTHMVTVRVQPHPQFARNDDDLLINITVSLPQAVLGCEAEITHLDQRRYRVKIPAGIQPGQTVRMKGLGMQNPQFSSRRGDLFVRAQVQIPAASQLTDQQKQSIIQLGYQSVHHA